MPLLERPPARPRRRVDRRAGVMELEGSGNKDLDDIDIRIRALWVDESARPALGGPRRWPTVTSKTATEKNQ